jgi:hypothetical protein
LDLCQGGAVGDRLEPLKGLGDLLLGAAPALPNEDLLVVRRQNVFAPDGRPWLIEKDAERLEWDGKDPRPMAGQFTLKAVPADTDPNARRFAEDVRASQHKGFGNLVFGGVLVVLGPILVVLSLWMRRDVRLVASRAEAAGRTET